MGHTKCLLCGTESQSLECTSCGTGGEPFFPTAFWGRSISKRYGASPGVADLRSTGDLTPRRVPPPPPSDSPRKRPPTPVEPDLDLEEKIRAEVSAELEARKKEMDRRENLLADWERSLRRRSEVLESKAAAPPPQASQQPEVKRRDAADAATDAVACLEEGDLEGAAKHYREAAHAGEESAWMNLAEVLLSIDRPEDALQAYDAAIIRDPTNMAALMAKFSLLVNMERIIEAVDIARLLLQIDGGASRHLAEIAGTLELEGRRDDAVTIYSTLLEVEPDNPVVHVMLGILMCEMDDPEGASVHVEEALKLDPNNALAWYAKGLLMNVQGRWGAAVQHFDRALAIRWDFPEAWTGKGEIHIKTGHHAEAEEAFRKALARRPKDPSALLGLAEALSAQGRLAEASEVLNDVPASPNKDRVARLMERFPPPTEDPFDTLVQHLSENAEEESDQEDWLAKGKALMDVGESEEAAECFARVLELEPEHEMASKLREECLAQVAGG